MYIFICSHFERPERITKIIEAFTDYSLIDRMQKLASREATTEELCLMHTWSHVNAMRKTSNKNKDLQQLGEKFNSIYFHEATFKCATLAVGSVLEVVDKVLNEEFQTGNCIVRPPGHHSEAEFPHGSIFFFPF